LSTPYGRGAAIWPESSNEPVRLVDSFPNGIIPDSAQKELLSSNNQADTADTDTLVSTPLKRRRRLPRAIQKILTRAAIKEEYTEFDTTIDKTPAVLALALLAAGLVQPVDVLIVSFLSGYFSILGVASRALRSDGITPVLPSLPPQGHVPALVSNPLNNAFTQSSAYDIWLRFGTAISVVAPFVLLTRYLLFENKQLEAANFCARPLFLLCCQAVSESVVRRVMAPLPIRILVPVAYNTVRLAPLWSWTLAPVPLGVGRMVAMTNLLYWALNLFGFLLPIASIRYMRAYFFNVEAEQVTTRPGMGNSVGLLS
jgi:hypothetical protein